MVKLIVIFSMFFEAVLFVGYFLLCLSDFKLYREYCKAPVKLEQYEEYCGFSDGRHIILDSYQIISIEVDEQKAFTKYTYTLEITNDFSEQCGTVELILNDSNHSDLISDIEEYNNSGLASSKPPVIDGYIINISHNKAKRIDYADSETLPGGIRVIPGECGMTTSLFIIHIVIAFIISVLIQLACAFQLRRIGHNQSPKTCS